MRAIIFVLLMFVVVTANAQFVPFYVASSGGGGGGDVTYDNSNHTEGNWTATPQVTWTIASASNRFAVVAVFTSLRVDSIKAGSVHFARIDSVQPGTSNRTEVWGLVAPTVGSLTATVYLSASAASIISGLSFYNVNQSTPTGTVVHNYTPWGTALSSNVGAATGDLSAGFLSITNNGATPTSGSGQTTRDWYNYTGNYQSLCDTESGATSVTMSYSWTGNDVGWLTAFAVKKN
jgi:hypothetical protein